MTKKTTTTNFIGLLRGINVGKAKRMPMAELRALVESLGYSDAKTLLNSGNVVFKGGGTAAQAAKAIEDALPGAFGFGAKLTVLDADQWRQVLADNPLLDQMTDPSRLLVVVWRNATAQAGFKAFAAQDWSPDQVAVGRQAGYLWCTEGILDSRAAPAMEKALRDDVTARNWTTALKIGALLDGSA